MEELENDANFLVEELAKLTGKTIKEAKEKSNSALDRIEMFEKSKRSKLFLLFQIFSNGRYIYILRRIRLKRRNQLEEKIDLE